MVTHLPGKPKIRGDWSSDQVVNGELEDGGQLSLFAIYAFKPPWRTARFPGATGRPVDWTAISGKNIERIFHRSLPGGQSPDNAGAFIAISIAGAWGECLLRCRFADAGPMTVAPRRRGPAYANLHQSRNCSAM
jgi:hypothetical protein